MPLLRLTGEMIFTRKLALTSPTCLSSLLALSKIKIAGSRHTDEESANLFLHVLTTKRRMACYATRSALTATMVLARSAGSTVPAISVTMALFASNPSPMVAAPVMLFGTKDCATVKTAMLVASSGAPCGIPDAELVSGTLHAAFAHPIAQLARQTLASHVLRLLTVAVLVTCFPADPIRR